MEKRVRWREGGGEEKRWIKGVEAMMRKIKVTEQFH